MKINLKHLIAYLAIVMTMLYLVFLANGLGLDFGLLISLTLFGGVSIVITLVFCKHNRDTFNSNGIKIAEHSAEVEQVITFMYAMGTVGVLLMFAGVLYFIFSDFHRLMPEMVPGMTVFHD